MTDVALTYSYEVLSVDSNTSVAEVLYKSNDISDNDVIVYIKIDDPTNKKAVLNTLHANSPITYWVRIRNLKQSGYIKNTEKIVKDDNVLNSLKGINSSVTNMIGPNGAEPVGDLFSRNKLRANLVKVKTGKI